MFNVFVNTTAKIINAMGLMSINMETQYLQIVSVGLVRMARIKTELFVWNAVGTEIKFQINHNVLILVKLIRDKVAVIKAVVAVTEGRELSQGKGMLAGDRGVSKAVTVEINL